MEEMLNIIDAVNTLDESINVVREKGLISTIDIDVTYLKKGECVVSVHGISNSGSNYTSLELHTKNGLVYWENIPVGFTKDLLPEYNLLHYEQESKQETND